MASKILKDFREYWDKWHKEWYEIFAKDENPEKSGIYDWKLPKEKITYHLKGKQIPIKLPIYLAIPEPYWISKEIINEDSVPRAVFFNINPGPNKFYHLLDSKFYANEVKKETDEREANKKKLSTALKTKTKEYKKLERELKELKHGAFNQDKIWDHDNDHKRDIHNWSKNYTDKLKYSDFINDLIDTYKNEKKFWHFQYRLKWVKDFEDSLENIHKEKCQLKDIATFEYFPFHTNKADEIELNWINQEAHNNYLLNPAVYLSRKVESEELKNKIISRGNWNKGWKSYFNEIAVDWKIFPKKIVVYPRFNKDPDSKGSTPYTLNICHKEKQEENPVFFLNFDGGGAKGMSLPTLESKQTVCFIEICGDKYISVYFDEFMREIDKYIFIKA
jgi:hypothetical protein